MFDQLLGLVLLGLGLKNPVTGDVAGMQSNITNELKNGRIKDTETRVLEIKNKLSGKSGEQIKMHADKILTKIGELNSKGTQKMNQQLARLFEILDKMTTRVSDLKAKGFDTSSAEEKLATAKAALAAATNAVTAQAGKVYAISSIDSDIKTSVSASVKGLKNDLRQVESTIGVARKALKDAAISIKALSNEPMTTSTPAP